jgi:hypothetical protein
LLNQICFWNEWLAFEFGIVFGGVVLNSIKHPLQQEKRHLIGTTNAKGSEWIGPCLLFSADFYFGEDSFVAGWD